MSTYFETPSDTGVTHTELVGLIVGRVISDTGSTITETKVTRRGHVISDTGTTFTESLVRQKRAFRTLSDTGTTITESLPKHVRHYMSDTGTTTTDSPVRSVVPGADSVFTFLCSRNWNYIENPSGWSVDAYARFTYSVVPD